MHTFRQPSDNHPELRWLIARMRASGSGAMSALFDDFAASIEAHLNQIDERLPVGADQTSEESPLRRYVDGEWYLKRNLAGLRAMDRQSDLFRRRLLALCNQLERQLMVEATVLVPLMRPPSEPSLGQAA